MKVEQVIAEIDSELEGFIDDFAQEFLKRVKQRTPVITGTLQRGWTMSKTETEVEISNDVAYASYVEYGTPKMEPRAMLRTTLIEAEQIAEVAKRRAGLDK